MSRQSTLSGTALSPLCFGAMQFGGNADETASREMYDACRAAGVNFFDTAHIYTGGASETILGGLIAAEREAIFLATKVGYTGGSSRETILSQFDESRARLNCDVVDLLYLHRWDGETPLDETFATLAELQNRGQVRALGVSNYAAWQVMKAQAVAQAIGTRIDALQPMYSLVKRQAEVELFPMARDQGLLVAPYSPLGGGLLTGKYASGGEGRLSHDQRYARRYGVTWMHEAAAGLAEIAGDMQVSPATLAVAWAMRHVAVTAPIISARSAAQLAPSLAAATYAMSDDLAQRITALVPAPPPATDRLEEA